MTALAEDKQAHRKDGVLLGFEMAAAETVYGGSLSCINAAGYALPGSDTSGLIFEGVAEEQVDNSSGSNGDLTVILRRRGLFKMLFDTAITIANVGDNVFLVDDQTVDLTANVTHNIFCGVIAEYIDTTHAWVDIEPAIRQADVATHIADGSAAHAASAISGADAGGFTDETELEAMTQEIYQHLLSAQKFIPVSLMQLREATNFDVGAITANGGVLASDTTPVLEGIDDATDGCQRLVWVASNNDQVIFQTPLPPDIDVTADLVLHTRIASGGTTDAVGFTVDSFFNEGDTKVTDTSETNQTATVAEKITTIAADDIPAGEQTLTVGLTPVAHTTDTMNLIAAWLEYTPLLLTS